MKKGNRLNKLWKQNFMVEAGEIFNKPFRDVGLWDGKDCFPVQITPSLEPVIMNNSGINFYQIKLFPQGHCFHLC